MNGNGRSLQVPYFGPRQNLGRAATPNTRVGDIGSGANLMEEYGRTGLRHWGGFVFEEWLRELQWGPRAAEVYREMVDNDPVIGGMMYAIDRLCRHVDWRVEPGSSSKEDKDRAEWVESNFRDLDVSWEDQISEILSFLTFGWSYFEMCFKVRDGYKRGDPTNSSRYDDKTIGLSKMPIRAQDSLWKWVFDDLGNVDGMIQNPPPDYLLRYIPMSKALLFRTTVAKGDPQGRSVLRSAYKAYYMLRNIQALEGIGIERDLAGLPILSAPEGVDIWDTNDPDMVALSAAAKNVVSSIRRDEQEGVILPSGWTLELLSAGAGSRRQFSTTDIITRYEQRIATSVLLDVILLGQDNVGSYALAGVKKGLFTASLEAYLDQIATTFNTHCIPLLYEINGFPLPKKFPELKHGTVESVDLDTLGQYVQRLSMAGAPLFPDDTTLRYLTDQAGIPMEPEDHSKNMLPPTGAAAANPMRRAVQSASAAGSAMGQVAKR